MNTSKNTYGIHVVLPATILVALAALPAKAAPGKTTWTGYLYQGPSYRFSVADEVPQASSVEVGSCGDGWCQVTFGDRTGYMRSELISRGNLAAPRRDVLAQPAAAVGTPPRGPCFSAYQSGGNGGKAATIYCQKEPR